MTAPDEAAMWVTRMVMAVRLSAVRCMPPL